MCEHSDTSTYLLVKVTLLVDGHHISPCDDVNRPYLMCLCVYVHMCLCVFVAIQSRRVQSSECRRLSNRSSFVCTNIAMGGTETPEGGTYANICTHMKT